MFAEGFDEKCFPKHIKFKHKRDSILGRDKRHEAFFGYDQRQVLGLALLRLSCLSIDIIYYIFTYA